MGCFGRISGIYFLSMRVVVVTLGYAPARILLACLDQVYKTIGLDNVEHYLLNNRYPIDQERNDKLVKSICDAYGITYFDLGYNLGLSAGYNYLIEQAKLNDDDLVIGIDPDVFPVTPGWGAALFETMQESSFAWASLQNPHSKRELTERGFTEIIINKIKIQIAHQACVNSVCMWRYGVLKQLGFLQEPKKYYGGIESMMFPMVQRLGKHWVYLSDFHEMASPLVESEPLYKKFKWEYAHKLTTTLEFKEWLKLESQQ